MNTLILDTNAYNRFTAGDSVVLDAIQKVDIVHMSIFVLGELLYAFKRGTRERGKRAAASEVPWRGQIPNPRRNGSDL